jgi:uncharacterized repeat protein (TIGR01451 family)
MMFTMLHRTSGKQKQTSAHSGRSGSFCHSVWRRTGWLLLLVMVIAMLFGKVSYAFPVQNIATGTSNGILLDTTNATVSLNVTGNAVTSVVSEISPNIVTANTTGNTCTYDILPTINGGDTGVDQVIITAPAGFSNHIINSVSVGGAAQTANCPSPAAGEYCESVAGQVMTINLGDKIVVSGTNIRVTFTEDAPTTANNSDFTATVDDASSPDVPQSSIAGDADGDMSDNNSITMQVIAGVDVINSTVTAQPQIVIADGVASSTITTALRNPNNLAVTGRDIVLSSDRGIIDAIIQPAAPTDASGVAAGTISSSTVGISTVSSFITNDSVTLPMQPMVYFTNGLVLQLTKSANKKEAVIGDIVTYSLEIRNTVTRDVEQIKIYDQIPQNFKYIEGSTLLNGVKAPDPTGHRPLIYDMGTVPALVDSNGNGEADPGESGYISLSYQLVIGSGATPGDYINTAIVKDVCDICYVSNEDEVKVTVGLDPIFDLGTIIGKVFHDKDQDGWQDRGEAGIADAMVVLDNGTYVLTDEYGRYHFPVVTPGHRLVKLNIHSIPFIAKATSDEARILSVTPGLLVKANFGVDVHYETESIGRPGQYGLLMISEEDKKPIQVMGSADMLTVLINGDKALLPSSDITMVVEGLGEVVQMKGGQLEKPIEFQMKLENPHEVSTWRLMIRDSSEALIKTIDGKAASPDVDRWNGITDKNELIDVMIRDTSDALIRTIDGKAAPPDVVRWNGITDKNELIKGGEVYHYQMEVSYTDGTITKSARRIFGVNQTSSIALNLTGNAFEMGSHILSSRATSILKETADVLRKFPREKVIIEGHTDSIGTKESNLLLSEKRARAAMDYLVDHEKIPAERFIVKGYGESRPAATNENSQSRELNRRVEVKGNVVEIDRAKLHDQFRTLPLVRINGLDLEVDRYGRYMAETDVSESGTVHIEVNDQRGRNIVSVLPIPTFEITEPGSQHILAFGEHNGSYLVAENLDNEETLIDYTLTGQTEAGNIVELDGKEVLVSSEGTFSTHLLLNKGNNTFGSLVRNKEGCTRIINLNVSVNDRDEKGKPVVIVKPVPVLTVNFPPEKILIKSDVFKLSGTTDPENQIHINGRPIPVASDGSFTESVKLTNGKNSIIVKATDPEGFEGTIERQIETSQTRLFLLAFVDGKYTKLKSQGNVDAAGFGSKSSVIEGRISYYLKGTIAGKYLITSAFDTGTNELDQLFKDLDEVENDRLLTNIDPDKVYPVYGDSSTIVYDTESQGKFYLAIESDELQFLVGNYPMDLTGTELATYQRTLYGASFSYRSASKTKYGQPDTEAKVFGAEVHQKHVHDELRATGGSLYYLSQNDVIEGSEQITIVIRDKNTGTILSRIPQQQNDDYTIKYSEGRILFTRPISSVVQDDSIIDLSLLGGNTVFIYADYERYVDSFEKSAYGGRVRKQITDHLSVGGTYVSDEMDTGNYELQGVDTEIRLGKNTRIIGEYAASKGTDAVTFTSTDGGLTYHEKDMEGMNEGIAWKAAAELDIGEWFGKPDQYQFGAYMKKLEFGFFSNGNRLEQGTEKMGLNTDLQLSQRNRIRAQYDREETEATNTAAGSQTDIGTFQLVHNHDWWRLTGEYQTRSVKNSTNDLSDKMDLAAANLSMDITEKLTMQAEHQQTITGTSNDQTTLGLSYDIHPALTLKASGTRGSLGDSLQGEAVLTLGDKRFYVSERLSDDQAGHVTSTVVGADARIDLQSRVYSEYQWENAENSRRKISLIGAERQWDLTKGLEFSLAGEKANVSSDAEESSRYALAAGLFFTSDAGLKASTRHEVRNEKGSTDRIQYLTSNRIEVMLSPDYTVLGKYRYSITKDKTQDKTEATFEERSVGLAYRPVAHDRLNALAKYTYLSDQRPLTLGSSEFNITAMDVVSLEWSFDITKRIEWVEKGALKKKTEETGGRPELTTHTKLVINRFNVMVYKPIVVGLEYRILTQKEADDRRNGWLAELMWEPVKHIRLGTGYNFTDFTDNEFSDNNYSVEGWFLRVQGKY